MTAATDFSALCKTPALAVMGGSLIGTQASNSSVVSKGLCSPDLLEAKISNNLNRLHLLTATLPELSHVPTLPKL